MALDYVLITPAHNEDAFIEKTLQSVIAQTVLPKKWVIVSDGSTDRTDDIVRQYTAGRTWIEFVRLPERKERHFAAKVNAFNAGYELVKSMKYEIIGNLDADVSFEKDFFEFLVNKFEQIPNLGVAGTPFIEKRYSSINDSYEGGEHVAGQCQLFRRACYESIGGYPSVKAGHVDKIAVVTARMKGWKTRSFSERTFYHHRPLGTGGNGKWKAGFNYGKKDYRIGRHPLFEIIRIVYRMTKKPYIVGGIILMSGYVWAVISREKRPVSREFIRFYQKEQMIKLKSIFESLIKFKKFDKYPEDI
jgi:glycosyltransferase involved in cell wall biosynthesis